MTDTSPAAKWPLTLDDPVRAVHYALEWNGDCPYNNPKSCPRETEVRDVIDAYRTWLAAHPAEQPRESGPVAPHGPHSPSGTPEGAATQDRAAQSRTGVPCPEHPNAPVIGGMCGGCTQYPTDMLTPDRRTDSPDSRQDSTPDTETDSPMTSADTVRTGQDAALDDALREQYARAIHRYDYERGLSGNDIPSEHHRGEAAAVLAVRDRRMAQLAAGRQTWKQKALEMEAALVMQEGVSADLRVESAARRDKLDRVRAECDAIEAETYTDASEDASGHRAAIRRIRAALDGPAAEQPAPTTYAQAQQRHIQILHRRRAAIEAVTTAWERLELDAVRDLVRLSRAEMET